MRWFSLGCFRFAGCVDFRWVLLVSLAALISVGLFLAAVLALLRVRCESWLAGRVDFRLVFSVRWLR